MAFVPSNSYIIMGHGDDPENVTLKDEQNFKPCDCKIKAKLKDTTIGTKSTNGLMDLDSFFIVPENCIIVVKARPGELAYANTVHDLYNKIGSEENHELFINPLSNIKELLKQLGVVSIFKPGDKCPNFKYILFYSEEQLFKYLSSHMGLIETPFKTPLIKREFNDELPIINTINEFYAESIFPEAKTVRKTILQSMLNTKNIPANAVSLTFGDMLEADESQSGKLFEYLEGYLSVTQKQLLQIDDEGKARRPGVYYNFVCRDVDGKDVDGINDYLVYNENLGKNNVNPEIVNIRKQPPYMKTLFNRVLNETLRKRAPYVRNSYVGGKRKKTRKNKNRAYTYKF